MWLPNSGVQCLLKIYKAKFQSGLLHCSLCFGKVGLLCLRFSRSGGLCCCRPVLLGAVSINICMGTKSSNLCTCIKINCF